MLQDASGTSHTWIGMIPGASNFYSKENCCGLLSVLKAAHPHILHSLLFPLQLILEFYDTSTL